MHCDSCEGEGALDTPLLYEQGWGKKLTYIISFGDDGVKDVTEKYSKAFDDVLTRRKLVSESWLAAKLLAETFSIRKSFSQLYISELEERDDVEEKEMVVNRSAVTGPLPPRQSGSIDWRKMRGEMG
jgi:peptide-N4-(N-acetyl-beta-glucosaminyl)asparagine amidase